MYIYNIIYIYIYIWYIFCPRCREEDESHTHFIFYCKLSKVTLAYTSELINLNYYFNIPFKFSLKTIMMDFFSILWWFTFENSTKILEVILMHLFKVCHEDRHDKIKEFSNYKCSQKSCKLKIQAQFLQCLIINMGKPFGFTCFLCCFVL